MEQVNNSSGGLWGQQLLWEEANTSELSPSVSVNLSLDVLPEKDIMSIVMKRKIGGTSSTAREHDSSMAPAKKLKIEKFDSNVDNRETVEFPTDRDDFILASFKCLNSNSHTETNSFSAVANTTGFNIQSKDSLPKLYSDGDDVGAFPQNHDKCFTGIKDLESFTEKDISMRKSDFSSPQCKNTDLKPCSGIENEHHDKEIGKNTTELESKNVIAWGEFTREKFNERSELHNNRSDLDCFKVHSNLEEFSQIEGKCSVESMKDVLENNSLNIFEKEYDMESQKNIGVNHTTDIHGKQKDTEEKVRYVHNIDREINQNKGNLDPREGFDEGLCQNIHIDSKASDEVDSLSTHPVVESQTKSDNKKSRKQYQPKRLPKSSPVSGNIESTMHCTKVSNEVKSGKSRKQNIPKRVIEESDTAGSDLEYYYDDVTEDAGCKLDDSDDSHGGFSDVLENFANRNHTLSQEESAKDCIDALNESSASDPCEGNNYDNSDVCDNDNASISSGGISRPKENFVLDNTTSLDAAEPHALPFHFQTAFQTYTNKLLQLPDQNDLNLREMLGQEQSGLTENLEVVKKLREIRFNRYRKISIEEKKEIAEYAKFNGVSSAALHFGVSKSAVSMWSRIDFATFEEERNKRKRHCMMGNQKFEELIKRVRNEKANKFKFLSREDKFEVSRYAKLIGVREMARCLDIALGTVSGWMRQFPYLIKATNQEAPSEHQTEELDKTSDDSYPCVSKLDTTADPYEKIKTMDTKHSLLIKNVKKEDSKSKKKQDNENSGCFQITDKHNISTIQCSQPNNNQAPKTKNRSDSEHRSEDNVMGKSEKNRSNSVDYQTPGKKLKNRELTNLEVDNADEIDEMIAESYETPDVDKCFEDVKELIKGSLLEDDSFFEKLFKRVVECRLDKYKSLKASEKLEVVRYAKRVGVRRIAKILGLATGTLSGWTSKYQAHLGLTSEGMMDVTSSDASLLSELDSSLNASLNSSNISSEFDRNLQNEPQNSQQSSLSPLISPSSSLLDNPEKAEVTAVKLILKDRFDFLREKINIARKIKFRNITHSEKIEVVKCTKLAGIRPTARVLNMPIGTLSGWITKYTGNLHPVYQEECNKLAGTSVHRPPPSDSEGMPGSQDYIFKLMNSQWPGIHHLSALYTKPETETIKQQNQNEISPMPVSNDFNLQNQQGLLAGNVFEANIGTPTAGKDDTVLDAFHEEAKNIAQEYLQSLYNKSGLIGK